MANATVRASLESGTDDGWIECNQDIIIAGTWCSGATEGLSVKQLQWELLLQ